MEEMSIVQTDNNDLISGNPLSKYKHERLNNDYTDIVILGNGNFGQVLKVTGKLDNVISAIKIVQLVNIEVLKEVHSLSKLNHENVVKYVDCWKEENQNLPTLLYIKMELCTQNLREFINQGKLNNGWYLPYHLSWTFFLEILEGLFYIHKHTITHRDIKPENIMVTKHPEHSFHQIKIGDFGLAKVIDQNNRQFDYAPKSCVGTKHYIAPEVKIGKEYDKKCDVYSTGVVLFELYYAITSDARETILDNFLHEENLQQEKPLFPGNFGYNIHEPRASELRIILTAMLQIDPEKRPSILELKIICNDNLGKESPTQIPVVWKNFFGQHNITKSEKSNYHSIYLNSNRYSSLHKNMRRYYMGDIYNSITKKFECYQKQEFIVEFMEALEYSDNIAAEVLVLINDLRRTLSSLSKFEYKFRINHVKIIEAVCVYFGCNTNTIQKIKGHLAATYNQTSENSLTPAQQLSHACHIDLLIAENILYFLSSSFCLESLKSKLLPFLKENEDAAALLLTAIKEIELIEKCFMLHKGDNIVQIHFDLSFIYQPYCYSGGLQYILQVQNPENGVYETIVAGGKYNINQIPKEKNEDAKEPLCGYGINILIHEFDKFCHLKNTDQVAIFPSTFFDQAIQLKAAFQARNYSAIVMYDNKVPSDDELKEYFEKYYFTYVLIICEKDKVIIKTSYTNSDVDVVNEIHRITGMGKYFNTPLTFDEAMNFLISNKFDDIHPMMSSNLLAQYNLAMKELNEDLSSLHDLSFTS